MRKNSFYHPVPFKQRPPHNYNLNHQSPYATDQVSGLDSFNTPFTQYAKPKQPENWYESMHHSGLDHSIWQENQSLNYPYEAHGQSQSGYGQPMQENINPNNTHLSMPPFQQDNFESQHITAANNHPQPNYPQGTNPNQVNNLLNQFQNSEGQLDVDKMLNTVGQLANTYHQVVPIFKQFSSFMKNFRTE